MDASQVAYFNNEFIINASAAAFPTSPTFDAYGMILRTNGSGTAPFDQAGSLIYRPRLTATTGRSSHLFYTGATPSLGLRVDELQNVIVGSAALATNATSGFLYIETCAGAPTGTPTTYTGRVATVYDTTDNKLYIFNGSWRSVTLA